MGYHANMNGVVQRIRSLATNRALGEYAAEEARRLMEPFVPLRKGKLRESAIVEPWRIIYTIEYAKYQFYGKFKNYTTTNPVKTGGMWHKKLNVGDLARSITMYLKGI